MSLFRFVGVVISVACLLSVAVAADEPAAQTSDRTSARTSAGSAKLPAILPQQFGGWQMQGSARIDTDPAVADPSNAAVMKEYGFSDLAIATYTRDDGRTLKIRAARFADASGAFGAYTFYLQPEMTPENAEEKDKIGDQAAFLGQRVLFYRGHVLVDAQFSRESAMSGEQLRELARALPRPSGSAANLPTFIEFMPHRNYIANTQKYAMGPAALTALAPPVSAELVDFGASSEVTFARYDTASGEAMLMLISYPTPQLAADHLRRIEAARQMAQPQAGVSSVESPGSFAAKRTGPIVVIASGSASDSDAKSLRDMVNYEASVVWNQRTDNPQARDLYMLILNIVVLCGILAGLAVVAGVAFGGIRIMMKRWYPDKVFDRPEQMEFISLRLTETVVKGANKGGSDGSRQSPQNPA
jgi:hypothetical protein